jgi:hypothetical protein
MTRFIAIGLLLIILRLAVKNFTGQFKISVLGQQPGRPTPQPPRVVAETLVRCARCGTYISAARALKGEGVGEGEVFCSEECRRVGGGRA